MKNIEAYLEECLAYMMVGGTSKSYPQEEDVEMDLYTYFAGKNIEEVIKNQVECDSPDNVKESKYIVDLVLKASDGYLPIEIKHCVSASKEEIDEDIEKLKFYVQHYINMPKGLFIYYTNDEKDTRAIGLTRVLPLLNNGHYFYYKQISRGDVPVVNFDERWDAKK